MNTETQSLLSRLGVPVPPAALSIGNRSRAAAGPLLAIRSPIDGAELGSLPAAQADDVAEFVHAASEAFLAWRRVPAPARGELVRRIGLAFREHKEDLAALVTLEVGKIAEEARGEVQEVIDICDFAVGLSRQLGGRTLPSERPAHRLSEQWHPLGPIGVITAFNFPVAVWAWNAMLALVCGDTIVWKPSEKAPLSALACQAIVQRVLAAAPEFPDRLVSVVVGGREVGESLSAQGGLPLISATGSVPMGRAVGERVAARLGRALLELGGNNGLVVAPSADLELAVRAITFAAVGTCGQRCTSLRRLIAQRSIAETLVERLKKTYASLPIGDPRHRGTLVGPLVDERAWLSMQQAIGAAQAQGGRVFGGGRVTDGVPAGGVYARPAIVEIGPDAPIVQQETFAPILYVMRYDSFAEAIAIHNNVPQGLSSAIFTTDIREAELFTAAEGSDCGIANVNLGTSGAEIGGAFGGEKETGGGRESGSDSWKAYMRRQTNTINYGREMPLAQGVRFDAEST